MIALLEARRAGLLTRAHLPYNIVAGITAQAGEHNICNDMHEVAQRVVK